MKNPKFLTYTGTGDIALSVNLGPGKSFTLSTVECHFTGGTGDATFTIARDSRHGSIYDTTLKTLTGAGTDGSDVTFYVPDDEVKRRYVFAHDTITGQADSFSLAWTNPDTGVMRWAMQIGVVTIATDE